MKTKKLPVFDIPVNATVNNEYPTTEHAFRQPMLWYVVGTRTSGKSHLVSQFLAQCHKDKTFDRVYIVTPSFNSNKKYFEKYINEEDVFEPTGDSIGSVIQKVENDRDEWEKFLAEKKEYKKFQERLEDKNIIMSDAELLESYYNGYLDQQAPKWKYGTPESPPKSCLILDDVIGSAAILQSSGLSRIATLNRHIAPLKEDFKQRSACGLAVIVMSQCYRFQQGISKTLRENVSVLTLFSNKMQKQMDVIKEECCNIIDEHLFDAAFKYATKEKYGSLTIDFKPKCTSKTFRKNLNEVILFDELQCECSK